MPRRAFFSRLCASNSSNSASEKRVTAELTGASLFNQLLPYSPGTELASPIEKRSAERAAKRFTFWTRFVPMMFRQPVHADSSREMQ